MSSAWGAPPAVPAYSDAPYGRSPSGRPYKIPPAGWVPTPVGPPPAPPREPRSLLWLWLVAGGAALLVVVLVVGLTVADRMKETARIQAQAAATTISMPPQAGGLVRSIDPKVTALTRKAIADGKSKGLPSAQAAGYGKTATGQPAAIAWGAAGPVEDPQSGLTLSFASARRGDIEVVGVAAYPPGPLGGSLQCGELKKPAIGALCGWADHGSIVLVLVVGQKPERAAALVLRMRADIEHRRS